MYEINQAHSTNYFGLSRDHPTTLSYAYHTPDYQTATSVIFNSQETLVYVGFTQSLNGNINNISSLPYSATNLLLSRDEEVLYVLSSYGSLNILNVSQVLHGNVTLMKGFTSINPLSAALDSNSSKVWITTGNSFLYFVDPNDHFNLTMAYSGNFIE